MWNDGILVIAQVCKARYFMPTLYTAGVKVLKGLIQAGNFPRQWNYLGGVKGETSSKFDISGNFKFRHEN